MQSGAGTVGEGEVPEQVGEEKEKMVHCHFVERVAHMSYGAMQLVSVQATERVGVCCAVLLMVELLVPKICMGGGPTDPMHLPPLSDANIYIEPSNAFAWQRMLLPFWI